MFGFGKKKKIDGVVDWKHKDESIERQLEKEQALGSFIGDVQCPSCYKITGLRTGSMKCEYCQKALGTEGLNRLASGEEFYFCTRCNSRFPTLTEYKDHHFKYGHA
jgi:hypothetical protein